MFSHLTRGWVRPLAWTWGREPLPVRPPRPRERSAEERIVAVTSRAPSGDDEMLTGQRCGYRSLTVDLVRCC